MHVVSTHYGPLRRPQCSVTTACEESSFAAAMLIGVHVSKALPKGRFRCSELRVRIVNSSTQRRGETFNVYERDAMAYVVFIGFRLRNTGSFERHSFFSRAHLPSLAYAAR